MRFERRNQTCRALLHGVIQDPQVVGGTSSTRSRLLSCHKMVGETATTRARSKISVMALLIIINVQMKRPQKIEADLGPITVTSTERIILHFGHRKEVGYQNQMHSVTLDGVMQDLLVVGLVDGATQVQHTTGPKIAKVPS